VGRKGKYRKPKTTNVILTSKAGTIPRKPRSVGSSGRRKSDHGIGHFQCRGSMRLVQTRVTSSNILETARFDNRIERKAIMKRWLAKYTSMGNKIIYIILDV